MCASGLLDLLLVLVLIRENSSRRMPNRSSTIISCPPNPCTCHDLPIGSCPENISQLFTTIKKLWGVPGVPANMDGLRIPLPRPSFPLQVWKFAFQDYFDYEEIMATLEFGWDFSFLSPPNPKDTKRTNVSASI